MQHVAALGDHADGTTIFDEDFAHATLGIDLHARRNRRLGHGLADRAHATDGVAPGALDAVHLAKDMVKQYIGATRCVRARVVADDAIKAKQRLDRLALEPAIQILGCGNAEQVQQLLAQRCIEFQQALAELAGTHQLRDRLPPAALSDIRRRLQHQRTQHIGDGIQSRLILGQALGVSLRKLGDFRLGHAFACTQVATIRQWQEIAQLALDDAQPMRVQIEVADHFRLQQGNRVSRD